MAEVEKLLSFLDEFGEQLKAYKKQNEKDCLKYAPQFTPFEFISTDEMGLSYLISYFLNPAAPHGQGRLFLDGLLRQLSFYSYLGYDHVEVEVEKTLQKGYRRHDILLKGYLAGNVIWVISIENKLRGAADQNNQIKDYLEDIKKYNGTNYNLLYVTCYGAEPEEKSINRELLAKYKENRNFITLSANDLFVWLDDSLSYSDNVALFISQFKQFIKEDIMGIEPELEKSELINEICRGENSIGYFFQLARMKDMVYVHLMDELAKQLEIKLYKDKIKNSYWRFKVSLPNGSWIGKDKYLVFECIKEDRNFEFILGTDTLYFNPFYFAFRVKNLDVKNYDELVKIGMHLKDHFGGGRSSKWCPYWCFLNEPYGRNWETAIKPWQDIPNGKLADYIFEKFQEVAQFLDDNNYI